jgi:hypothetical protein
MASIVLIVPDVRLDFLVVLLSVPPGRGEFLHRQGRVVALEQVRGGEPEQAGFHQHPDRDSPPADACRATQDARGLGDRFRRRGVICGRRAPP